MKTTVISKKMSLSNKLKGENENGTRQFNSNEVEELRAAFAFFDRNGDGSIEADELGAVMESLGYHASESELRDMIHEADIDGNNMIDFEEFIRMMETKSNPGEDKEEELREAFKVFDCDGNGFISPAELKKVMKNIGENLTDEDLNEMISEGDKNGDGLIDFDEFVEMLSKQ